MADIPLNVQKRAIFSQEFRTLIESKNIWSEVATKLVATAKNIFSPFTSVTAAKAHLTPCVVPIGVLTVGSDELVLDRLIGNAITDCEEELSYANFDIIGHIRGDLYASVQRKANVLATADILADATVVAGTVELGTAAAVRAFLIGIGADTNSNAVGLRTRVDGATVTRAPRHGKPFVAAGRSAFVQIISQISGVVAQSSPGYGLSYGDVVETPYGVTVINLGDSAVNPLQLIYGVAGVPTLGYREDMIDVGMGEMTSTGVYSGYTDLDLEDGDPILNKTWYMYAQTKGRNGIFSNVASLVSQQLAVITA